MKPCSKELDSSSVRVPRDMPLRVCSWWPSCRGPLLLPPVQLSVCSGLAAPAAQGTVTFLVPIQATGWMNPPTPRSVVRGASHRSHRVIPETESRLVVVQGWGQRDGGVTSNGYRVWGDKNVLQLHSNKLDSTTL